MHFQFDCDFILGLTAANQLLFLRLPFATVGVTTSMLSFMRGISLTTFSFWYRSEFIHTPRNSTLYLARHKPRPIFIDSLDLLIELDFGFGNREGLCHLSCSLMQICHFLHSDSIFLINDHTISVIITWTSIKFYS